MKVLSWLFIIAGILLMCTVALWLPGSVCVALGALLRIAAGPICAAESPSSPSGEKPAVNYVESTEKTSLLPLIGIAAGVFIVMGVLLMALLGTQARASRQSGSAASVPAQSAPQQPARAIKR